MAAKLSAGELANKLERKPTVSPMRRLTRFLFSASVAAGLALHAPTASAGLSPTPEGAYQEGYETGQAYAAQGLTGESHGINGDPAIDNAYNNGFIDGIEGLPANPPTNDPPAEEDPAPPTLATEIPTEDPQEAYEMGFELGLGIDGLTSAITGNEDLDAAFDDGFGDAAAGEGPSCASACGADGCATCASCDSGGCGSCGGCGGCGGCG